MESPGTVPRRERGLVSQIGSDNKHMQTVGERGVQNIPFRLGDGFPPGLKGEKLEEFVSPLLERRLTCLRVSQSSRLTYRWRYKSTTLAFGRS